MLPSERVARGVALVKPPSCVRWGAAVDEAGDGRRALGTMRERKAVAGVGEHLEAGIREGPLERGHDVDRG